MPTSYDKYWAIIRNACIARIKANGDAGIRSVIGALIIEGSIPNGLIIYEEDIRIIIAPLRKSKKYISENRGNETYLLLNPDYKWSDAHPVMAIFRTAAVGAAFSLLVGYLLWLLSSQKQARVDEQQDKRLNSLSDSITILQKQVNGLKDHP